MTYPVSAIMAGKYSHVFADDFPIICDDAHVVKGISSPC